MCIIFFNFAFKNSAPNSASDADPATNFRMMQRATIVPLGRMG